MVSTLTLIYFGRPRPGHTTKTSYVTFQIFDPEITEFRFFIKGSGTSFSTTFCVWFFKENISHGPNFIVWLPFLLEILSNMCIWTICCPVCDAIKFEIYHSSLIKLFFYTTKKSGQKSKYLKNKKSFLHISHNSVCVAGLEYWLGILNDINHSLCISSVSEKPGKFQRVSVLFSTFLINLNLYIHFVTTETFDHFFLFFRHVLGLDFHAEILT